MERNKGDEKQVIERREQGNEQGKTPGRWREGGRTHRMSTLAVFPYFFSIFLLLPKRALLAVPQLPQPQSIEQRNVFMKEKKKEVDAHRMLMDYQQL